MLSGEPLAFSILWNASRATCDGRAEFSRKEGQQRGKGKRKTHWNSKSRSSESIKESAVQFVTLLVDRALVVELDESFVLALGERRVRENGGVLAAEPLVSRPELRQQRYERCRHRGE
jgi:hypothetical protein